jgi:hypothetical protein
LIKVKVKKKRCRKVKVMKKRRRSEEIGRGRAHLLYAPERSFKVFFSQVPVKGEDRSLCKRVRSRRWFQASFIDSMRL